PDAQPDYLDLPGRVLPDDANTAEAIIAAGAPDAAAIIHHETGDALTYGDLARHSAQLANLLKSLGVGHGDRVAFRIGNRPEAILLSLATWRLGAVIVPTPPQARTAELKFFLEDTEPKVLVALGGGEYMADVGDAVGGTTVQRILTSDNLQQAFREESVALPRAAFSGDSVAIVWHTGGTTGTPKGCYHTHRRFMLGGYAVAASTGIEPGERWAAAAPIGHALGFIYHTIYTLLHGATVVTIDNFARPEVVLEAIARHQVGTFTAISATWARMLGAISAEPRLGELPSLTRAYAMWQSASSTEVYDAWKERGIELLNNFGSTAFATWVLVPRVGESFPPASLGRPSPGYLVQAIEPDTPGVVPVPVGTTGR